MTGKVYKKGDVCPKCKKGKLQEHAKLRDEDIDYPNEKGKIITTSLLCDNCGHLVKFHDVNINL